MDNIEKTITEEHRWKTILIIFIEIVASAVVSSALTYALGALVFLVSFDDAALGLLIIMTFFPLILAGITAAFIIFFVISILIIRRVVKNRINK